MPTFVAGFNVAGEMGGHFGSGVARPVCVIEIVSGDNTRSGSGVGVNIGQVSLAEAVDVGGG